MSGGQCDRLTPRNKLRTGHRTDLSPATPQSQLAMGVAASLLAQESLLGGQSPTHSRLTPQRPRQRPVGAGSEEALWAQTLPLAPSCCVPTWGAGSVPSSGDPAAGLHTEPMAS